MGYARIRKHLSVAETNTILEKLAAAGEWTEVELQVDVLKRDPSDNVYLACTLAARAGYPVTGDRGFFDEIGEVYQEIRILTPRTFLEILAAQRTR